RADEALQLEPERLSLRGLEPDVLDDGLEVRRAERLPALLQAIEVAATLRQVEREIARVLEDPELAGAVAGDPARGDVRDRAVRELDPRVRDVHVGGENRDPGRPHVRHL